jgi:hypothetical protein
VGAGAATIESSICVATITGLRASLKARNGCKDFRMRQGYGRKIAFRSRGHKANGFARPNDDPLVAQGADVDLGALQVHQNADRLLHLPLEPADRGVDGCMIITGSMAEVEAECVHTCEKQRLKHLGRSAGRANGCYDFACR